MTYPTLQAAVGDLDEVLVRTTAAFTIQQQQRHYLVRFKFAWFGPDLDNLCENDIGGLSSETVAQYPDVEVALSLDAELAQQLAELDARGVLGTLHTMQIPPGSKGNDGDAPLWVVRTHSGSTAERIQWLNSIA